MTINAFTVSVSVWGICPHRTAFFSPLLDFFNDIYVGFGLNFGWGSIGGSEDEDADEDEDEKEEETGDRK